MLTFTVYIRVKTPTDMTEDFMETAQNIVLGREIWICSSWMDKITKSWCYSFARAAAEAVQPWFCFNPWKGGRAFSWCRLPTHKARMQCSFSVWAHILMFWAGWTSLVTTETISCPKSVSGMEALETTWASMLAFPLCFWVHSACGGFFVLFFPTAGFNVACDSQRFQGQQDLWNLKSNLKGQP